MNDSPRTVPEDFPRDSYRAAVPGAQPKFVARKINGKYVVGLTPEELYERWEACEDLARQLMEMTLRKKDSGLLNDLEAYYQGLERLVREQPWDLSSGEVIWLLKRTKIWVAQKLSEEASRSSLE